MGRSGASKGVGSPVGKAIAGGLALGWIAAAPPLGAQPSSPIRSSGSSTVGPITVLAIQGFTATGAGRGVTFKPVVENGTSAGFREFCAGTTALSQASRPINGKELSACKAAGVDFYELPIGFDAITVVVHPSNSWARDISLTELKKLWSRSAQQTVNRWKQVRTSWPERPIKLYGPGRDSGTFDYFTKAITGEQGNARTDVVSSEDDNSLVKGVANNPNSLGYFGFAYYKANAHKLRALAVAGSKGTVLPSWKTVQNETYQPLSRPMFIYVNARQLGNNPALRNFIHYYLNNAADLVRREGSVPLSASQYRLVQNKLFRQVLGTAFAGELPVGLTLGQLLNRSIDANKKPQFRL
jgi:phosphate transport system substrate-binding protein